MKPLAPLVEPLLPRLISLRHEIHAHPEPGYEETLTSAKIRNLLETIPGLRIRTGVGVTGIVATLAADKPGPCVALRADMDCLPLTELNDLPYASRRPGLMHACGHDGHTVCLLGAALVLSQVRDELQGPVKFLFQPAEEGGAGGKRLVEEGALENPRVDAIFGLHNMPMEELLDGQIATRSGPFMAASGNFRIVVQGRGGHAATPHLCIDPLYVGAQIVNALQSIVSRQTNPVANGVVSVTVFQAGSANNVIPQTAEIRGTFRSLDTRTHAATAERIAHLARQVAAAFGAGVEVTTDPGYPVLVNDRRCVAYLSQVVKAAGYQSDWRDDLAPVMGGEDFAYYTRVVPGCFWFLGTRQPDQPIPPPCHSPFYDFPDYCIARAVTLHCEIARRFAALWSEQ